MCVCAHRCVCVKEVRAKGAEGAQRARSLQLCKLLVTLVDVFSFHLLVSHYHTPFYYLENSLWNFSSVPYLCECNTSESALNSIKIQIVFSGALVTYFWLLQFSLYSCIQELSLAGNGDLCVCAASVDAFGLLVTVAVDTGPTRSEPGSSHSAGLEMCW